MTSSRVPLLGTEVDALSFSDTMDAIVEIIETGTPTQHLAMNAAKVVRLRSDPVLRAIASECGIISADGVPLVWASRLLGHPLPGRVNGTDLMEALCDLAGQRRWSVFFFGARQDVVEAVAEWAQATHPGLRIAGIRNGYFDESENDDIVAQIASSGASILFLGFPTPRKELWLHRHLSQLNTPFCMGVGGSFDVIAGKVPRAPRWMQRNGLEWLFRLIQEPKRMWKRYLVGNTQFVLLVLSELITRRLYPLKARALSVPILPSTFRRGRSFVYSLRRRQRGEVFADIYTGNRWRDKESRSGSGSNLVETVVLRRELPSLLASVGATTLLDAPCGDFHWMCEVDLGEVAYLGVDIVPEMIERNQAQFGDATRSFEVRDVVKGPLPAADVVMCRDCLVHLSFREAMSALANFRASGATYLLTTTFTDRRANYDKHTGGWRPLNLCAPPFNLPTPLRVLNEGCNASGGAYADKSLGLWRLADLDVPSP